MEYEIVKENENTWRIEDQGVRFFLLTGTQKALLIDSGMNVHNAKEIAESITNLPISLLNTHADPDHIGSNGQFGEFYMNPNEEQNLRENGSKGKIIPVYEGTIIDLGERPLEIIELPGHTSGSIAVLDVKSRILISGDPIQDGHIFMFGVHRNMELYIESLEKLEKRSNCFDYIFPSHGTLPVKPEIIGKLIEGAKEVLAGKIEGKPQNIFGNEIHSFNVGCAVFLCK